MLAELLDSLDVPAWFSFSARGSQTSAGQPLAEAFSVATSATCVFAVGVNCCAPSDVLDAVRPVAEVTDRPAVACPKSGEQWGAGERRWRGDSAYDVSLASEWAQAGTAYVGGCCRVGPRDIAALAAAVKHVTLPKRSALSEVTGCGRRLPRGSARRSQGADGAPSN